MDRGWPADLLNFEDEDDVPAKKEKFLGRYTLKGSLGGREPDIMMGLIEVLKKLCLPILGIIFNGEHNPDSESAILEISQVPVLGRLLPEANLTPQTIQRYAKQWQPLFSKLLP